MATGKTDKLGAGWKSTGKSKDIIANGELSVENLRTAIEASDGEKVKFVMFVNTFKKAGDNRPDFNLVLSRPQAEGSAPKQSKSEESFF